MFYLNLGMWFAPLEKSQPVGPLASAVRGGRDEKMESTDFDRTPKGRAIEFYHLKIRPEYPRIVKGVAIALLYSDTETKCLYFDRPPGSQWVASLWIDDGACQVDLAAVLKEDGLEFIEGYCSDDDFCSKVEDLKRAILASNPYSSLRQDLIHELFERAVGKLVPGNPLPSRNALAPAENKDLRP